MLLGASLVIAGVLVSALADRIRGIRAQRSREFWREAGIAGGNTPARPTRAAKPARTDEPATAVRRQPIPITSDASRALKERAQVVTSALTEAGFTKSEAVAAVAACTDTERDSLPEFTRAALQRAREAR
jgi:hypothetical protein